MGNGAHEAIVYRGVGYRGYRPHGLWGTGGMSHMDNGRHGQWGTGGVRYMDNGVQSAMGYREYGVQGLGAHGQWGTGQVMCQNVKSCQKDVKCQKIKHLDYGGGSQKKKLTQ